MRYTRVARGLTIPWDITWVGSVMLFNERGELLLIRNSYGRSHLWVLPGGGIGRRETPEAAAAREVREEVAVLHHDLAAVSHRIGQLLDE